MYKAGENTTYRVLEGEAVVLNVKTGNYYTLNETATRIYEMVVSGSTPDQIAEKMTAEHEVNLEEVRKDIDEQIRLWIEGNLIEKSPQDRS